MKRPSIKFIDEDKMFYIPMMVVDHKINILIIPFNFRIHLKTVEIKAEK